jgi:ABC-type transport system involved in multi-copper enzyme maturation permease subunit
MFRALRRIFATTRARLSMPLLRKELTETAARRRTYILRVIYALTLFGIFAFTMPHLSSGYRLDDGPQYALLGFGRELFQHLVLLQVFGVLLFQPALMCGRITQEKERDSLVLLFLTELRPWEIVLQKYLGGLVPMLSFLLLGLPLAGISYAFGGMENREIVQHTLGLLLLTLQVGALTLMCSAWCRSTVGALISSYFLGAFFYAGPPLLGQLLLAMVYRPENRFTNYYEIHNYFFLLIPQAAVDIGRSTPVGRLGYLAPSILSVAVFVIMARVFLVRRAFVPPLDFLPRLFARLDRFMKWANRFVGGFVLYRDTGSLPAEAPIFWRETQRRVLGKAHYLFRVLCLIEIPTVLLCMLVVWGESPYNTGALSVTAAILGVLILFSLSATAANSIVSERVGQTLDVLLTTPLSAWQIVREKERALRRLEWVLAAPLLTIFGSRAFLMAGDYRRTRDEGGWIPYLVCTVLTVAIYLPMTTWLSLWIGLRVRTRFQAILTALGSLTAWMALTPLLVSIQDNFFPGDRTRSWLFLGSPMGVPFLNETGELLRLEGIASPWPAIIANAVLYGAVALFIRFRLWVDADRCLRR